VSRHTGRIAGQSGIGGNIMTEHHTLSVNGIRMHVATAGRGPLLLLCHGWPELWYSWRHQIAPLAAAGFRVVVPDMRGFGRTEGPVDIQQYSIMHLVGDMVSLLRELGAERAAIIGHDWGAPTAWTAAMLRPDLFPVVVGMSVAHRPRSAEPPMQLLRKAGLGNHYWLYFQTPSVAEAEFEADVSVTLRHLMYGIGSDALLDRDNPLLVPEGRGFLARTVIPPQPPAWLPEHELAVFIAEYQRTGFRGGLNLYRNMDRNWELTAPWDGALIQQPALFIAGTRDPVVAGQRGRAAIEHMTAAVPNVHKVMIDGAGHWLQQQYPQQVNAALLEFLGSPAVQRAMRIV
jgi:pimeloyl-ACP methyl ester carboxylesterase